MPCVCEREIYPWILISGVQLVILSTGPWQVGGVLSSSWVFWDINVAVSSLQDALEFSCLSIQLHPPLFSKPTTFIQFTARLSFIF